MSVLVLIDGKNELYIYRGMKKVNSVGVGSGDAWQARFIDAEKGHGLLEGISQVLLLFAVCL